MPYYTIDKEHSNCGIVSKALRHSMAELQNWAIGRLGN